MEFKQKKHNNFWHSPVVLLVIFCFLIVFAYNTVGLMKKERETAKNKEAIVNKIDELENKKEYYNSEIESLNTEKGMEELARSKFSVKKPGEKEVSIVLDDDYKDKETVISKDHSFWTWIKNMFK